MTRKQMKEPSENIDPMATVQYEEGALAFHAGEPEAACPYRNPLGFIRRRFCWLCGHFSARTAKRVACLRTTDSRATSAQATERE